MHHPRGTRRPLRTGFAAAAFILLLAACTDAGSASPSASTAGAPTASPASTSAAPSASSEASPSAEASESAEASGSAAAGAVVIITGQSFGVDEITVPAGQPLMVVNESSLPHTFTEGQDGGEVADPRVNASIPVGGSVPVTFPEPGDYQVTCLFHSSMNMVVHVE